MGAGRWNGAYFYSKEIVEIMIPLVRTDRNWVTINIPGVACDHSIVFIHNNKRPEELYDWLKHYKDLILVCGIPETCKRVKHLGRPIYLPLSVNVEEVEQYRVETKVMRAAFAGRPSKRLAVSFPEPVRYVENMPRKRFLSELAKYARVYAVGRVAIEAKILGAEVMPYDSRFPDPSIWKVIDTRDAAKMLQAMLDELDV